VNFLDTADIYPMGADFGMVGRTEQIVGRWVRGRRDQVIIVVNPAAGKSWSKATASRSRRSRITRKLVASRNESCARRARRSQAALLRTLLVAVGVTKRSHFWALVTFPWVVLGRLAGDSVAGRTVWAAPPTGASLTRQGRFASLRDGLRPPLTREPLCALWAGERAGQGPARGNAASQTRQPMRPENPPTEASVDPIFGAYGSDGSTARFGQLLHLVRRNRTP